MNNKKYIANNNSEKKLELGKYLESDMIELTSEDVTGGVTPAVSVVSAFVSWNTCPTTACTDEC